MIYRIENDTVLNIPQDLNSPAYLRISGLYKAYGNDYNFIGFYTNTNDTILVCIKQGFADIYTTLTACEDDFIELKNFILLNASEISAEREIDIGHKSLDTGKTYTSSPIFDRVSFVEETISNTTKDCYAIAEEVFLADMSDDVKQMWYTDLSHRVRHGMTITYTIPNISTAIAYAFEDGVVLITYLATIQEYQNQGYAKFLLQHIANELKANKLILQSKDEISDKFYEKLGFTQVGEYFNYKFF